MPFVCKHKAQIIISWWKIYDHFHLTLAEVNVLVSKRKWFFEIEWQFLVDQKVVVSGTSSRLAGWNETPH